MKPHIVEPQNKLIEEMGDHFGIPNEVVAPDDAHAAAAYCRAFSDCMARVGDEGDHRFELIVQRSDGSEAVFNAHVSRLLIEVQRLPLIQPPQPWTLN